MINIDWVKCKIFMPHRTFIGNNVLEVTEQGELIKTYRKSFSLASSSTSITINSYHYSSVNQENSIMLEIDGNLSKFLNGHNIFGASNLNWLICAFLSKLVKIYPENFSGFYRKLSYLLVLNGFYFISRLDINKMYDISNNNPDVTSFIRSISSQAEIKYRGTGTLTYDTLYFGKNSRRWAVKIYNKQNEIRKNQISFTDEQKELKNKLIDISNGYLRVELVLRLKQLLDKNSFAGSLRKPKILNEYILGREPLEFIFEHYVKGIDVNTNVVDLLSEKELGKFTPSIRGTYKLWFHGEDILSVVSKATFYRHRKELLKVGINIAVPRKSNKKGINMHVEAVESTKLYDRIKKFEIKEIPKDIDSIMFDLEGFAVEELYVEYGITDFDGCMIELCKENEAIEDIENDFIDYDDYKNPDLLQFWKIFKSTN